MVAGSVGTGCRYGVRAIQQRGRCGGMAGR